MHFSSLMLRIWWEPGWGFRASVRPVHGEGLVYFKSLEELNHYLEEHALRLKPGVQGLEGELDIGRGQ